VPDAHRSRLVFGRRLLKDLSVVISQHSLLSVQGISHVLPAPPDGGGWLECPPRAGEDGLPRAGEGDLPRVGNVALTLLVVSSQYTILDTISLSSVVYVHVV
jgi:hypothetical protein